MALDVMLHRPTVRELALRAVEKRVDPATSARAATGRSSRASTATRSTSRTATTQLGVLDAMDASSRLVRPEARLPRLHGDRVRRQRHRRGAPRWTRSWTSATTRTGATAPSCSTWDPGDLPGWEPYGLLDSSGLPKNRLCKVEQHNAGTQIAPCPCAAGKLGCAGVPW